MFRHARVRGLDRSSEEITLHQESWISLQIKVNRGAGPAAITRGFRPFVKKQLSFMENFASIRNLVGFVLPLAKAKQTSRLEAARV
jgi:hypothetical protein